MMEALTASGDLLFVICRLAGYALLGYLILLLWRALLTRLTDSMFDFFWRRSNFYDTSNASLSYTRRLVLLREFGLRVANISRVRPRNPELPKMSSRHSFRHTAVWALSLPPRISISIGGLLSPWKIIFVLLDLWLVAPEAVSRGWNQLTQGIGWLIDNGSANLLLVVAFGAIAIRVLAPQTLLRAQAQQRRRIEAVRVLDQLGAAYSEVAFSVFKMQQEGINHLEVYARDFVERYSAHRWELHVDLSEHPQEDSTFAMLNGEWELRAPSERNMYRGKPPEPDQLFRDTRTGQHRLTTLLDAVQEERQFSTINAVRGWLCPYISVRHSGLNLRPPPYPFPPRASTELTREEIEQALLQSLHQFDYWVQSTTLTVAECRVIGERAVPHPSGATESATRLLGQSG